MNTNIKVGKTLYHGTLMRLAGGFPTSPGGNWFATDPQQSILHALKSAGFNQEKTPYLYIYKIIKTPRILKFNSGANFTAWANSKGIRTNSNNGIQGTNKNYELARKLCTNGEYDGWWLPSDQTQVMLCRPSGFLQFVKVLEIKRPQEGGVDPRFVTGVTGAMWKRALYDTSKISTVPVSLNNLIKKNQPNSATFYEYSPNTGATKLFNSNGVEIPYNGDQFNYKGRVYHKGAFTRALNANTQRIIANRIKQRSGVNVNSKFIRAAPHRTKANWNASLARRNQLRRLGRMAANSNNNNNKPNISTGNLFTP